MIRYKYNKDCLLFYELLKECEDIDELSISIDNLIDALRSSVYDLCQDKNWNIFNIETESGIL